MEQKHKKIRVKTNFAGMDFDVDVPFTYNVKDVLILILEKFNKDSTKMGIPLEDMEIFINGKEIWFYPEKLETVLKENDLLEIYLTPLGGG